MTKPKMVKRDPNTVTLLEVNARFMRKEQYDVLVANVRRDGFLSSVPLLYADPDTGQEIVLSGNHRTMAARDAGLKHVDYMLIDEATTPQQRVAIQLSHNAITGEDDPATLKQLYEQLEDVDWRDYSGLDDKTLDLLDQVDLSSLAEANLEFTSVQIMFLPHEREAAERAFDDARKIVDADARWLAMFEQHEVVLQAIESARNAHNVGNFATALGVVFEVFEAHLTDLRDGWYNELSQSPRHKGKAPLESLFGQRWLPVDAGAIVAQAIDKMVKDGDVPSDQRWLAVERWAADWLAGE